MLGTTIQEHTSPFARNWLQNVVTVQHQRHRHQIVDVNWFLSRVGREKRSDEFLGDIERHRVCPFLSNDRSTAGRTWTERQWQVR